MLKGYNKITSMGLKINIVIGVMSYRTSEINITPYKTACPNQRGVF